MSNILAQYPPALKVGGRRLSVSKSQASAFSKVSSSPTDSFPTLPSEPRSVTPDYPRPAAPGEEQEHYAPPHHDEDPLKKDKKQQKHIYDMQGRKADIRRPTRDLLGGKGAFGGAGRIAQPAGKGLQ
ncbi:hypothetical protein PLICRDRAFT_36464 [Plicaturopsis crispa FD-325 SS-3]|nr:hypothetical protein PLICRDRAFT_36464 [Plicaturopsis crispa FD-325 SS-3]